LFVKPLFLKKVKKIFIAETFSIDKISTLLYNYTILLFFFYFLVCVKRKCKENKWKMFFDKGG